jgi:ABC-type phosphate transport system auxiliary subunit
MSTIKDLMVPDEIEDQVSDEQIREAFDIDETKKKSLTEVGRQASEINLGTPVYDSNTDKLGELEPEQINSVIRFYRILEQTKNVIGKAVEAAEDEVEQDSENLEFSYDHYIGRLQSLTEELAERKRLVLKELNADEFTEIEDCYKANPTNTEQD